MFLNVIYDTTLSLAQITVGISQRVMKFHVIENKLNVSEDE